MTESDIDIVLNMLEQMANFKTSRTGLDGYYDFYERVEGPSQKLTKMGSRAYEGLIVALDDENPQMRYYAIKILGTIRDKRAIASLQRLQQTETIHKNRQMIQQAITQINTEPRTPEEELVTLLDTLKNGKTKAKREAVKQIRNYRNYAEVVPPLIEILHHNSHLRSDVLKVLALHRTSHQEIVTAVLAVLPDDPKDQLWDDTVFALRDHRDPRNVPIFIESLNYPEREHAPFGLRNCALSGYLTENDAKAISDYLVREISSGDYPPVMQSIGKSLCNALGSAGYDVGVLGIVAYVNADFGRESQLALGVLSKMTGDAVTEALIPYMNHENEKLHGYVYRYAGENRVQAMLEPLQAKLDQPDLSDKERARIEWAIGEIMG